MIGAVGSMVCRFTVLPVRLLGDRFGEPPSASLAIATGKPLMVLPVICEPLPSL